jgi:hypothetical protein
MKSQEVWTFGLSTNVSLLSKYSWSYFALSFEVSTFGLSGNVALFVQRGEERKGDKQSERQIPLQVWTFGLSANVSLPSEYLRVHIALAE